MQPSRLVLQSLRLAAALVAAVALPTALLLTPQTASAGNGYDPRYRYCLDGGITPDGPKIPDCAFDTAAQCRVSSNGFGFCIENPAYKGVAVQSPRAKTSR